MSDFKIEQSVPVPEFTERKSYPFPQMEVGDSFEFPQELAQRVTSASSYWGKRNQRKFITRTNGDVGRIWRVE